MRSIAPILPSKTKSPFRAIGNTLVTLACLVGAARIGAQTKRCDLVGRDTTINGNPSAFKRCLDLDALNGKTVNVPLNVTRIDNDGLSLCKGAVQSGGDVDIAYIYDNSGSMTPKFAYINTATNDTIYYESMTNCSNQTTNGNFNFYYWNATGTTQDQIRNVTRMNSNAGCTEFAGDPYQTRARAYYLGIKDQASRAPQSTAGIMSFANTTAHRVLPKKLNTQANIDAVLAGISAGNDGGTAYRPPTDTAKAWLTNSSITSNTNKAIIFLSDGKPKDDNPAWNGPSANMPKIYGIFLGRPRADTAALYNMSQATGGKFYLIPPDDPDSLKSVVAAILNIVLLQYSPQTATVTNSSLNPAQTATSAAADFILQADGSWLMKLNDVIGLKRNASNSISFSTTFKEKTSGTPETRNISFTISTTLAEIGTTQKIGTTQFGATCFDKSNLKIQNTAGARPAYFTEADKNYRLRLRTGQNPLTSVTVPSSTALRQDAESPVFTPPAITTVDSLVFGGMNPFLAPSATRTNGNGTLESNIYDSIIVSWVHPRDAQDVAADTMLVRASIKGSTVWFSQTSGGPATALYPITATTAYIVVKDQPADPRRTYTAIVTSTSFGLDKETVTLTESPTGSGTLVGSIPINQTVGKNSADGKLQVSTLGDQLQVVYKDPVDGDSAISTAGFAQLVEEAPDLKFTDASGTPLPPGTIWSPANGKLYISYSDDSVNIGQKQVFLTLASKKYGSYIATDHERIPLTLTTVNSETRATWTGSIDLAEAFPVADSNGKAEMRFRGEATITANSHTNLGAQEANVVTSSLLIAYPDSTASISWKMDTTVTTGEGLIITVNDQTFNVNQKDTALVSVACTLSGDSVSAFPAVEGPTATSGTYTTGTLSKVEGAPNLVDKILSCLTTDQIRIRYVDPVYGTLTELLIDEVAKPVATPAGKTFVSAEKVELTSATPGADIYYTLDGSKPIPGVSPKYQDGQRLDINVTTTVKAIAVKAGFKDSKILTEVYTKQFVASRLEILDENGNAIPGGEITGAAKGVRVRLVTTQANLTSADVPATTKVAGDAETMNLGNPGSLGDFIELWSDIPLKHPFAKSVGNDTIEAIGTDTLIVRWVNPFNPGDVAADTITIKPAYVVADVYFSTSENGPKITEYPVTQDSIYVVVKTRPKDPALTYTVAVSSSLLGIDKEVLTLTELSPGVFSAKAPVGTGSKSSGDKIIQVAVAGDQLTAIFTDPVYKVDFRGDAGFAQGVQESALLEFIDDSGNVIPPTGVWSPAKGKVYIRFSDDWSPGIAALVRTKTADLKLVNRKSGDSVGADAESVILTLKDSTATRGTWQGALTLVDKSTSKAGNDTLESYFRGELRATVKPHTNAGLPTSPDAVDNLVIAYPDQPAEIVIRDTSGKSVERRTEKVEIIIRDQIFSNSGETSINATVTCAQSGDKVSNVVLVWDAAANAYVIKPPLSKGETAGGAIDKNDALLLCRDGDVLTVTYTDPVYETQRTADVRWNDETPSRMYYASTKDGSVITSISDVSGKDFQIVVEGKSPTRDKIDTIEVVLTSDQGEQETYKAIETGVFTGKFVVKADFKFQSDNPNKENKVVEARILVANRVNQVLVHGTADVAGTTLKADLALLSSYNMVAKAYIKDQDENGRADHAYFVFDHKLSRLPGSIDEVYWNQEGADFKKKAESSILSFLAGSDSTIVVADFSKSQFGANLTDIPAGKPAPYGRFPDDNLFGGQKAALADSIGPVITSALKLPSNLQSYNVSTTEKRFNPDTLVITVSEKIKTSANFTEMLRFSKGCAEYAESNPVKMYNEPAVSADGLTWVIIVDNAPNTQAPLVKDCLFLEADGRYTDLPGNRPARLGEELSGENPKLVIREFRGFPPVAGLDPSSPGFVISTNDKRDDQGGMWSNPSGTDGSTWQVTWIPPYGFDPNDPVGSLQTVANDFNNPKAGERRPEVATPQPLPDGISTVQVIASGSYKAQIRIFDNLGHFVRSMDQAYGGNGEDKNPWRAANKGQVSFLVWDMKDKTGAIVGNGVYVWKVSFTFLEKAKKSEVMYTRTGVVRR